MDALDLIAKIKMDLSEYEEGLDKAKKDAESGGSSIGGAFGKLASGGVKALTGAIVAAGAGVATLTTAAVKSYAEYEQLVGGVETLFGAQGMSLETYAQSVGKSIDEARGEFNKLEQAQNAVMENASKAYKTAGMSANEYMEQATSTAAALVNSLGGNTSKAAEYADKAIIDMSDNANKMGTDMEAIQNAYNGFAKGNFTMLDNLKLGYGGTKEEMERLLEHASKLSGIEYDVSNYADIVDAIHVVQDEMGITGTTAKEASETISGSLASTKSAWTNLMTALGSGEGINESIDALVESAGNLMGNLIPVAEKALTGVSKLIETLVPKLVEEIPSLINDVLPQLIESGAKITQSILTGISQNAGKIMSGLSNILVTLVQQVVQMLPQFIETGVQLLIALADGISQALPSLVPSIVQAMMTLVQTIVEHLPELIDAGIQIAQALLEGIIESIPMIIEALPELIESIITTLTEGYDSMMQGALEMFMAIVDAIPDIMDALVKALPDIIDSIVNFLTGDGLPRIIAGAVDMFMGIIKAIPDIVIAIGQNMPDIINAVATGLIEGGANLLAAAGDFLWNIIDAIGDFLGDLWDEAKKIGKKILDALADIPEKMYKLGKDIVMGLWNGIKAAATMNFDEGYIEKKVTNMYERAKKAAESNSPSKKFMRLGRWLMEGLAIGVEDEAPETHKVIADSMKLDNMDLDVNVNKKINSTIPVETQSTMKLSDSDIDKIVKGLSITLYNTTEIDSVPIKQEVYKYTLDRMEDETKALQIAQGGAYAW